MQFIGSVSKSSRINVYKSLIRPTNRANYHFVPEWLIEKHLGLSNVIQMTAYLLKLDWGRYRPRTGEQHIQKLQSKTDTTEFDITLMMDSDGVKNVYISSKRESLAGSDTKYYIATTDYYQYLCDGLNVPLFEFDETKYKADDNIVTPWQDNLSEVVTKEHTYEQQI